MTGFDDKNLQKTCAEVIVEGVGVGVMEGGVGVS